MTSKPVEKEIICGLDEVGRGPLAGPVVAAAVMLKANSVLPGLRDSKKLSERQRLALVEPIQSTSIAWGLGWVWQDEIDRINIHHASLLAMVRALDSMIERCSADEIQQLAIAVDGKFLPDFSKSKYSELLENSTKQAIIKGDSLIPAISAASILAKVERDNWMIEYHKREPDYGFAKHKGYPTAAHKAAIGRLGPSAIQRKSFNY